MRSIVVQKALVVKANKDVLLLRRSESDIRRPLQWDLPGGLVEPEEELIASIRREVKEETGLDAQGLVPVYATTEVRSWKDHEGEHTDSVTFIFYRATTSSADVKISFEHDTFQWTDPKQAVGQLEYDLHIKALEYIVSNQLL